MRPKKSFENFGRVSFFPVDKDLAKKESKTWALFVPRDWRRDEPRLGLESLMGRCQAQRKLSLKAKRIAGTFPGSYAYVHFSEILTFWFKLGSNWARYLQLPYLNSAKAYPLKLLARPGFFSSQAYLHFREWLMLQFPQANLFRSFKSKSGLVTYNLYTWSCILLNKE